jgi:geranylgeranyl pyrophosphate synthase
MRQVTPDEAARRAAFADLLESWRIRTEQALAARLPPADVMPARLHEAMRYSVLGGGKRVRPALVFATGRAVGLREEDVEAAACAIELVHVYSLVHDDLPAMDNDDLRRGKPSTHKAFDEATAILAGDALQTRAFEILAEADTHSDPLARCELVAALGAASGARGMAGGQMARN